MKRRDSRKPGRFRPEITNLEDRKLLSTLGQTQPTRRLEAHAATLAQRRAQFQAQRNALRDRQATHRGPAYSGVLTYHNDPFRTGWYSNEKTLTPQNVNVQTFGKLWGNFVDGHMNAQPLYISNVRIGGRPHNIIIAATENDTVYAFDADNPYAGRGHNGVLWQTSFTDPSRGVTSVPVQDLNEATLTPTVGIISTPAFDPMTGTLYVITKTKEAPPETMGSLPAHIVDRLHALNITNGHEQPGGPVLIGDTIRDPATGAYINNTPLAAAGFGSENEMGVIQYNAIRQINRSGLVLDMNVPGHPDGALFAAFSGVDENSPYHGWDARTLQKFTQWISTPDADHGGIWMSGAAPAVDSNGDLILSVGDAPFSVYTDNVVPGPHAIGQEARETASYLMS